MPDALSTLRQLEEAARRFDFFQAVRLLECAYPERPRVGESLRARDDFVRFVQEPELIFYPTTLGGFELGKDGKPPRLTVNFIGLLGPNGPLPTHLTEYVRDRARNAGDPTFARFLDVFHHRMVALFYRAWAQAQPAVSLDRPGRDRFSAYVGSVFGLAEPSLRERDAVPDFAKLHFAGLLGGPTRPAAGLRLVLSRFFGLPVEIEECVGHWIALPANSVSRLGAPDGSCVLGMTTCRGRARVGLPAQVPHRDRPAFDGRLRTLPAGRREPRPARRLGSQLRARRPRLGRQPVSEARKCRDCQARRHARLGLTSWLYSGSSGARCARPVARPSPTRRRVARGPNQEVREDMAEISRVAALFGKLNALGYRAIESASVFCKLRGNPYIELTHWFHQILQLQDSDLHRIIKHFGIDPASLARDLTEALDALPRGSTSVTDISSQVEETVERGWVYGSLLSQRIAGAHSGI